MCLSFLGDYAPRQLAFLNQAVALNHPLGFLTRTCVLARQNGGGKSQPAGGSIILPRFFFASFLFIIGKEMKVNPPPLHM